MKDLYQVLGLTENASFPHIRNAYKKLALNAHPDKGGNPEIMALINEAYEILSDPDKRRDYNERWHAYQEIDAVLDPNQDPAGVIEAGSTVPFSQTYRKEHERLIKHFRKAPQPHAEKTATHFTAYESNLYEIKKSPGHRRSKKIHDIFTFVTEKSRQAKKLPTIQLPRDALTPTKALSLFREFLAGRYYGKNLKTLKTYLALEGAKFKEQHPAHIAVKLFEGIIEILSMADEKAEENSELIFSLQKITDYGQLCDEASLLDLIPLFYDEYFRNLFAYAVHLYWGSDDDGLDEEHLQQFNGEKEIKELLAVLKQQLSYHVNNKVLLQLIRNLSLIARLEESLNAARNSEKTAESYREYAFNLLDWVPAIAQSSDRKIIVNLFLQIGTFFQQAARSERKATFKMADEKLALKMYLAAVNMAEHSRPDIQLYAHIHALKYISAFKFDEEDLKETIPVLQKQTLQIGDVFPFFQGVQSNVRLIQQADSRIHLLRRLLNSMMEWLERHKTTSAALPFNHSAVTLLYEAYEACLNNWYRENFDPDLENELRLELMEELLAEKGWDFADLQRNLCAPWVRVERDEQGWMKRSLPLADTEFSSFNNFRSIQGAEINHDTGKIVFFLEPWKATHPLTEKVFTLFDLHEMLVKNLTHASFSLDPVDPDKPYHPFNKIRFAPSRLYETEFLNTLLLSDYILKFLTTKQEVQGTYPYAQRSVEALIGHLPAHLKKILADFHACSHHGAIHRFWIEIEEVEILLSEDKKEPLTRIGLGETRMVLKKHRMERDIHGELKDVGNEDEGWPIYILTAAQLKKLEKQKKMEDRAIIFSPEENKVFFWEDYQFLLMRQPENFAAIFNSICEQPREEDGRILLASGNMSLLYQLTIELCEEVNLPHHFTPEFIFSHDFTLHYDEFAQYIPEFNRLKQLSKMASLVRMLSNLHEQHQEKLNVINWIVNEEYNEEEINEEINDDNESEEAVEEADTEFYQIWTAHEQHQEQIILRFKALQEEYSYETLLAKKQEYLSTVRRKLGPLTFFAHSPEVKDCCIKLYNQRLFGVDHIPEFSFSFTYFFFIIKQVLWHIIKPDRIEPRLLWQAIDSEQHRNHVARELSLAKREAAKRFLKDTYWPLFSPYRSFKSWDFWPCVEKFLDGNSVDFANLLVRLEIIKLKEKLRADYPASSIDEISAALGGSDEAVAELARKESIRKLETQKAHLEKIEESFEEIGLGQGNEEPLDLEDKCLWVPASIRHEAKMSDTHRSLFFVYGGVNVCPHLKISKEKIGPNGERLKSRVPSHPAGRYNLRINDRNGQRLPYAECKEVLLAERQAAAFGQGGGGSGSDGDGSGSDSDEGAEALFTSTCGQARSKAVKKQSIFTPETQRLLGKTDRLKAELFERRGKKKQETTLRAAFIELQGKQIPLATARGRTYDHVIKVQSAQKGLKKLIGKIRKKLSESITKEERKALEKELSSASRLLDYSEEFVPAEKKHSQSNIKRKVTT